MSNSDISKQWLGVSRDRTSPATMFTTFDPSDPPPHVAKALYVGIGGDLWVVPINGDVEIPFYNIPDGTFLPISIREITAKTTA